MRLIDADKLKEMFEKRINENNKTIFTHIIRVLDAMPTEMIITDKATPSYVGNVAEWILGCIYHDGYIETKRFDKANQVIRHALEKSIPQKPNKATTRYDEFIRFECPVCGGFLVKNYPCKCGQMVDWSDEE